MNWKQDVRHLSDLEINRCTKPHNFGNVVKYELHHFADASSLTGYGTCSYLRQFSDNGEIHVSFIMGKSRVVPLRKITVPRLDLTAALVAINISKFLTKQLKLENMESFYWTDSKVTLGYITNTAKRFQLFVANRIERISSFSTPSQWRHIDGAANPADIASREMSAAKLVQSELWFQGPKFIWEHTRLQDAEEVYHVDQADPEVKKTSVLATHAALA